MAEYGASRKSPVEHAPNIRALCDFAPIAWPHDGVNTEKGGGEPIKEQYVATKLNMLHEKATLPDGSNSVEASISLILQYMQKGKFKIFNTCTRLIDEKRIYHRKNGKIVKLNDDYIDAMRYAVMMLRFAITEPVTTPKRERRSSRL